MGEYYAKLPLKEGDVVSFDGEMWYLSECIQPSGDVYVVAKWENGEPTGVDREHIDHIVDKYHESDRVVIERGVA